MCSCIEEHIRTFGVNQPLVSADGADLNILHIAAGTDSERRDQVLEYILSQAGVDVNAVSGQGNEGWTAGHIAACWGYDRSLDLLLKHSADPYITDMHGLNVWDVANVYDNYSCIFVLESRMNRTHFDTVLIDDDDDKNSIFSNESASERTHFDRKFGMAFVEEKAETQTEPEVVAQGLASIDESICALDDSSLRRRLIQSGESPGPVVASTRNFYRRRLQRLQSALSTDTSISSAVDQVIRSPAKPLEQKLPLHPAEINLLVDGKFDFAEGRRLEKELVNFFPANGCKSYFNYLLVDPRISLGEGRTSTVPSMDSKFDCRMFLNFVKGIFYIGKGHGKRPLMHLYEAAFQSRKRNERKKPNAKCSRILDIWAEKWGVVSLHCFQNVSSDEALARECLMIEALGLSNLSNIQIGQNKVKLLRWTEGKKRTAGSYLLFKAYWIFCVEGQNQIRVGDVRF